MARRVLILGGMVVGIAVVAFWLFHQATGSDGNTADEGVVVMRSPAASAQPSHVGVPAPAATGPVLPERLVASVRHAYPLLTNVDFDCDPQGCAITATIPPPTGEAFLKKRQEMLVGGLAELVDANGYRMLGPVQMEEIDDNLFHIRAPIVDAHSRAK